MPCFGQGRDALGAWAAQIGELLTWQVKLGGSEYVDVIEEAEDALKAPN